MSLVEFRFANSFSLRRLFFSDEVKRIDPKEGRHAQCSSRLETDSILVEHDPRVIYP